LDGLTSRHILSKVYLHWKHKIIIYNFVYKICSNIYVFMRTEKKYFIKLYYRVRKKDEEMMIIEKN